MEKVEKDSVPAPPRFVFYALFEDEDPTLGYRCFNISMVLFFKFASRVVPIMSMKSFQCSRIAISHWVTGLSNCYVRMKHCGRNSPPESLG